MPTKIKYIKNDFFPWMDDILEKESLTKRGITEWHIYWDPKKNSSHYSYTAHIFWKNTENKYGYDYLYLYAYHEREDIIHNKYGPFDTFEQMKHDYETEGGYDMPFPQDLNYA